MTPSYELNLNIPKIDYLESIVNNKIFEEIKDTYIQKEEITPQQTPPSKVNQNEYKLIYKNIGQIAKMISKDEDNKNLIKKICQKEFQSEKRKN